MSRVVVSSHDCSKFFSLEIVYCVMHVRVTIGHETNKLSFFNVQFFSTLDMEYMLVANCAFGTCTCAFNRTKKIIELTNFWFQWSSSKLKATCTESYNFHCELSVYEQEFAFNTGKVHFTTMHSGSHLTF